MFSSHLLSATARELNISSATLRNWLKTGAAADASPETLRALAAQRLTRRANKTQAGAGIHTPSQLHFPKELSSDPLLRENVERILAVFSKNVPLEPLLFSAVKGYILRRERFSNSIQKELQDWEKAVSASTFPEIPPLEISYGGEEDFSGILYQTLRQAGTKSRHGAFYTPSNLVAELLSDVRKLVKDTAFYAPCTSFPSLSPSVTFLDPCCGTGAFLREARRRLHLPLTHIFGCDSDPIAVRLARLNLLLDASQEESGFPQIVCQNGLAFFPESFPERFSIIATNPPWGTDRTEIPFSNQGKPLKEMFSAFLFHAAQHLLASGGHGAFVLPEAFLNIRRHTPTRNFLLKNTRILKIVPLGRPFTGVFTPAIRLHFSLPTEDKTPTEENVPAEDKTQSEENMNRVQISDTHSLPQRWFLTVPESRISLGTSEKDAEIIEKMRSVPHITLKNHAEWGLGIVTGRNPEFLTSFPPPHTASSEKWEPVLCGPDVEAFHIREPQRWLRFEPERFQQCIPPAKFRVPEKIVYRFITSRPVFALDAERRLTLNSANFLIPSLSGFSTRTVLAFLNSDAFLFLFRHWFFTHKILRGDLEQLPFPKISEKMNEKIEKIVGEIFSGKAFCDKMNEIIFTTFHLTRRESDIIRRELEK